jgi:polyferredoxin
LAGSRRKGREAWASARRTVQALTLLGFLILFVGAHQLRVSAAWAALPLRLDPLAMLASSLASRSVLAGSALALITVASALVFGRAWCGWACPLGTLLDLLSLRRWRGRRPAPPEKLRSLKYLLLIAVLASALLGSLALLIFDPLTLLYRGLGEGIWPALDRGLTALASGLYAVPPFRPAVSGLDSLLRPEVFPAIALSFRLGILYAGVLVAVVGLNVFAERFWCRYLCPLGGLLGLIGKVPLVRREVASSCSECGRCIETCPTGTIRSDRGFASDPGECTLCMDCLGDCARGEVSFRARLRPGAWLEYDPGRREMLAALGAAAGGLALLRVEAPAASAGAYAIRPPGSADADLLSRCIRCSLCVHCSPLSARQGSKGFGHRSSSLDSATVTTPATRAARRALWRRSRRWPSRPSGFK